MGRATKACIDNQEKNLLNSNISPTCPHNMVHFGPLTAESCSGVWCTPANFNGFRRLGSVTARHSSSGLQRNFAALNIGRAAITLGIGPHSSYDMLRHVLSFSYLSKSVVDSTDFYGCLFISAYFCTLYIVRPPVHKVLIC